MLVTRPFTPPSGSAIDPLVEEVTWQAWEMTAFDPSRVSDGVMKAVNLQFDCLIEAAWLPGRSATLTEVAWDPDAPEGGRLSVRLAVGVFGPKGTTDMEALGLAPRATSAVNGHGIYAAQPIDPSIVVPGDVAPAWEHDHAAHVAQGTWSVGDEADIIEVVSRFNPTMEPWAGVVDQVTKIVQPIRVRSTVLATELSPADRLELSDDLRRLQLVRERGDHRSESIFDADRGEATLLDIRASFSSPVLAGEIAVSSPDPLPETLIRSLAASFTSECDVLRQQGRVVVAGNRLVLGGFEVHRSPTGWATAHCHGVPLRGGLKPRRLCDLVTLTESPIGWPVLPGRPIPTVSTHIPVSRDVPAVLAVDPARDAAPGTYTSIGSSPSGVEVSLPVDLRTRHILTTGSWGAGKSTLLFRMALDDLRNGRPFVFIDPHGNAADLLIAHARHLGIDPVVIDPADGSTDRLRVLPRLGRTARQRAVNEAAARRVCDAVASVQHNPEWTGPRWHAAFAALLELVSVHGGEMLDAIVWLNDPTQLRTRVEHPDLSDLSRSTLKTYTAKSDETAEARGWVSSKLHPVQSSAVRSIVAPVGRGVDVGSALAAGRPVIVSQSALARSEAAMLGHLVTSSAIDWAFLRPPGRRSLVTIYQDELPIAPPRGVSRVFAEGRKFGISFVGATQSLGQLDAELADLVMAAGTQVAFRATPDTAARLSSLLDVPAHELAGQPDLHATLWVQGHPSTSVVLTPYEECPVPRVVTPPKVPRSPRPRPSTKRRRPTKRAAPPPPRSVLDDFLVQRRRTTAIDDN